MQPTSPIRVALIDDHSWVHEAVDAVLATTDDIELVCRGKNGHDAVQLCDDYQPDLLLLDMVMPGMNGLEAARRIHQHYPHIKIIVLSNFQDDESVRAMLANGAHGYILKGSLLSELPSVIRATYFGQSVFSTEIIDALLHPTPSTAFQSFGLTAREREVLNLMAEGLNNGEVGARLTISASTVKFHLGNILQKMGVETRSEAIVLAAKNNLV
jgi:two-component system, NarL family, response regulator LiaR